MYNDSIDKIVKSYFAAVTTVPFEYKGIRFEPKPLKVSAGIIRGYTCPMHCGGCCSRFSLDYLPEEQKPNNTKERIVEFNNSKFKIFSDLQDDHRDVRCRNLIKENGRCGIYEVRPFSCDFELIRFMNRKNVGQVTTRLFSRGWAMKRTGGEVGSLCEILPATEETRQNVIRKLKRLYQWTQYFNLDTHTQDIIQWCSEIPLNFQDSVLFQNKERSLLDASRV